jgi:sensor c-di-GMP phosphodiesterase-like protein
LRLAPEIDRANDVGDIIAAHDDRWVAINHRVEDMPHLIIGDVIWQNDFATDLAPQRIELSAIQRLLTCR